MVFVDAKNSAHGIRARELIFLETELNKLPSFMAKEHVTGPLQEQLDDLQYMHYFFRVRVFFYRFQTTVNMLVAKLKINYTVNSKVYCNLRKLAVSYAFYNKLCIMVHKISLIRENTEHHLNRIA